MAYFNGLIYANVYTKDEILAINPKTGAVVQHIDMNNIYPLDQRPPTNDTGEGRAERHCQRSSNRSCFCNRQKMGENVSGEVCEKRGVKGVVEF